MSVLSTYSDEEEKAFCIPIDRGEPRKRQERRAEKNRNNGVENQIFVSVLDKGTLSNFFLKTR